MKTLCFFLALLLGFVASAQSEFPVHDNGLIYSDVAVSKLKHIVDSLNLKFKVCETNKAFISVKQARGHHVTLEGKRAKEALKDIEAGMSFEKFKAKYPRAIVDEDLLLLQSTQDRRQENITIISAVEIGEAGGQRLEFDSADPKLKSPLRAKWLFKFYEKDNYSAESIEAFYVVDDFSSRKLPEKYSRMISYSDCLIDTTSHVIYRNASSNFDFIDSDDKPSQARNFVEYIHKTLKRPTPDFDYNTYYETTNEKLKAKMEKQMRVFDKRDSLYLVKLETRVDSLKRVDSSFTRRLFEALSDAKNNNGSEGEFEDYVAKYISKSDALELKRHRIVTGGCSMDSRPREHAQQIALLAAETTKWEIFLRAHLDIMNDRMDCVSDGSYAWQSRKTYIKEIEVLDVNVPDLIFGISLRTQNAADNHYYSSIGRTGRALSESADLELFQSRMLEMISDATLDDFNRVLVYFMFDHYNYNLTDKQQQTANASRLKTAVATFPQYIASRIK
ncbi:MAG: hypothetical protein EOO50_15095 [Flavobacterium sp.]|uniref:hypothetical protein n=1 Tax=Flavobacterium sp. TaxID=239 RepID=UPI001203F825|nr:hypothetical protein [Flavobacterium sp.]RZJ65100.1 MAG: hypothetical protein EOO50_15095 [Flavobacterium sp.]